MMIYLFDTDTINFLFDKTRQPQHIKLRDKVSQLEDNNELTISILTLYELEYSFENAPEEKKPAIREVIQEVEQSGIFQIISLLNKSVSTFGKLKTSLKSHKSVTTKQMRKHNIDSPDLIIPNVPMLSL